ncbi:MAG: hypothetical protein JWL90_2057 [Chthoniobacteraceae bacterium]|nr:hypothetical protein [Chthoniobacteraceae bacterium]
MIAGSETSIPLLECQARELCELSASPGSIFWESIAPVTFREAFDGKSPRQATHLRCAWNASELRLLFRCEDDYVWATLTERDGPLYTEEVVEMFLDPVGDLESYFEIEVNPLNTVLDLVLRKSPSGYRKDFSWRCEGLQTRVEKDDAGWNLEVSIPFGSLTAEPPTAGTRWRMNFCRIDRPLGRDRELSAWSPPGRGSFHTPERFGVVQFTN